jgi:hypothetical protein
MDMAQWSATTAVDLRGHYSNLPKGNLLAPMRREWQRQVHELHGLLILDKA